MPIPDFYIKEGLKLAEGMTVFGHDISDLTKDELIACLAQLNREINQSRAEHHRQFQFLAMWDRKGWPMSENEGYKELVCVGGPMDGRRISILTDVSSIQLFNKTKYSHTDYAIVGGKSHKEPTRVEYRRQKIAGETIAYEVLTPNGMSGDELIKALIDGYKN